MSLDTGRATRRSRSTGRRPAEAPSRSRPDAPLPLVVAGAVAGLAASGVALAALGLVALAAWMLAPDADLEAATMLEAAAGAWLAGQGLPVAIQGITVSVLPLGFGLVCVGLLILAARWAVSASAVGRRGEAVAVTLTAATVYGLVAAVVAVLARSLSVSPVRSLIVCGALAAVVTGVVALRAVAPRTGSPRSARAKFARDALAGGVCGALLLLAVGALGVLVSLLMHMPDVGMLLSRLQPDASGAVLLTVLSLAYLPVATVWGAAYLLGPGFAIGDGHVIGPLSDVPATTLPGLPLLAALPAEAPAFGVALPLVGVAIGAVVGWLLRRRGRVGLRGAGMAAVSSVLAGCFLAAASWLSSGSLGDSRLAVLGPVPLTVGLVTAAVLLLGTLLVVVWPSREGLAVHSEEVVRG